MVIITNIKRLSLVIAYFLIFLFSMIFIFLLRTMIMSRDIETVKNTIASVFNTDSDRGVVFLILVISLFFMIGVMSTILMYMNLFLLEHPKFEKRVESSVKREIKKWKKKHQ